MTSFIQRTRRSRAQIIQIVGEKLEKRYGNPRLGNPEDPLDDLFFILLSNKTPPDRAQKAYNDLKAHYPSWINAREDESSEIERIIRPAGLFRKKTSQLLSILDILHSDFGGCNLEFMNDQSETEVLKYLMNLPGVSKKVAKCVMMYTLDFEVLPVDVHTHRIAYRLGWTTKNRPETCQDELEELIPHNRRYSFHVNCVAHGRSTCISSRPKCKDCDISIHCDYYQGLADKNTY